MGYVLSAVVARIDLLRLHAEGYEGMPLVELAQGFALLPLGDELPDRVAVVDAPMLGFGFLPGGFAVTLASWSMDGPVGYVEADYFGGHGEQRAAVWASGWLEFGPLHKGVNEPFPVEGSPISQALRRLGVKQGRHADEFDAVGLWRHRHTEDWIQAAGRKSPSTTPILPAQRASSRSPHR